MKSLLALAIQARNGDQAARIELFDRLRPYPRAAVGAPDFFSAPAAPHQDQSDLTQQALLRILQSLDQFQGSSEQQFHAWLKTIARNLAIDGHRTKSREISLDSHDAGLNGNGRLVADDDSSPSGKLLQAERKLQLAAALDQLPEDQRQAVLWRHFEDLSLLEIGRRLDNRSPAAAAQLIRRGICRLNQILSHLH